jgi:hypothetical protein
MEIHPDDPPREHRRRILAAPLEIRGENDALHVAKAGRTLMLLTFHGR